MAGPNFASYAAGESNTCKPTVSDDGTEYYFDINDDLRDCDTLVTNNGTHVTYEQAVQYVSGTSNSVITRVRRMKVNFTCIFDLEVTLTMEHAVKPIVEHFEVSFNINHYTQIIAHLTTHELYKVVQTHFKKS